MVTTAHDLHAAPLLTCSSVDDLKRRGSFREVKDAAQREIGERLRVSARGWSQLLDALAEARSLGARGQAGYFVSPAAEAIFYLVELDGESRKRKLGITMKHLSDKALAKGWRDHLAKLLHPDRCDHPAAGKAMAKLNEIYAHLIDS